MIKELQNIVFIFDLIAFVDFYFFLLLFFFASVLIFACNFDLAVPSVCYPVTVGRRPK